MYQKSSGSLIGKTFFRKYQIETLIDKGSFGQCFQGKNLENNQEVCLKIENLSNEITYLKFESTVLLSLQGGEGFPIFHYFDCTENYNILIMELLGNSLKTVFDKNNHIFPIEFITKITIQLVSININFNKYS